MQPSLSFKLISTLLTSIKHMDKIDNDMKQRPKINHLAYSF